MRRQRGQQAEERAQPSAAEAWSATAAGSLAWAPWTENGGQQTRPKGLTHLFASGGVVKVSFFPRGGKSLHSGVREGLWPTPTLLDEQV